MFIRAPFYVLLVFVAVFCLLFALAKLSLLAKRLARKTALRKPNRGEGIISRKPRLKSAYCFLGLLYCFIVLLCVCVVSWPTWYIFLLLWHDIFMLKVPLNTKQTNKQTISLLFFHFFYTVVHPKPTWGLPFLCLHHYRLLVTSKEGCKTSRQPSNASKQTNNSACIISSVSCL